MDTSYAQKEKILRKRYKDGTDNSIGVGQLSTAAHYYIQYIN